MSLLYSVTSRVTCLYDILPTDKQIKEDYLKHIAEISKNLEPIKSKKLNFEQQNWLDLRMHSPMGRPWKEGRSIIL